MRNVEFFLFLQLICGALYVAARFPNVLNNRDVFRRAETGLFFPGWNNFPFFDVSSELRKLTVTSAQIREPLFSAALPRNHSLSDRTHEDRGDELYSSELSLFVGLGRKLRVRGHMKRHASIIFRTRLIVIPAMTPLIFSSFSPLPPFSISLPIFPRKHFKRRAPLVNSFHSVYAGCNTSRLQSMSQTSF